MKICLLDFIFKMEFVIDINVKINICVIRING